MLAQVFSSTLQKFLYSTEILDNCAIKNVYLFTDYTQPFGIDLILVISKNIKRIKISALKFLYNTVNFQTVYENTQYDPNKILLMEASEHSEFLPPILCLHHFSVLYNIFQGHHTVQCCIFNNLSYCFLKLVKI